MRPLSDTIARLAALRHARDTGETPSGDLVEMTGFGSNPGALRAWTHIPLTLPRNAPLVVVLHGCTQNAAGYDNNSGWSHLAESQGFALLFPEQQRANNPNLCFNWFQPEDTRRGAGEALSIRQMIERLVLDHGLDRRRIFVTGLSAGGAMASVMLATYPEVFAGGAIIAGLPHGVAGSVPEAFDRMRGHGLAEVAGLEALVRGASDHEGPWPTISIWQGSADRTVSPSNAEAILEQWRGLHGVGAKPTHTETVDGFPHEVWCNREGRAVIERYDIAGMGHGTPLDSAEPGETAGAYMLDVAISSTRHIARFWGLAPAASRRAAKPVPEQDVDQAAPAGPITQIIETALRRAGLMR
jgi:poly(hydroxyalkanoate) depolymerase family esterase